jgi:hypothetical protein
VFQKLVTRGIRGSLYNICEFNKGNLTPYDHSRIGERLHRLKRKQELHDKFVSNGREVQQVTLATGEVKEKVDDTDLIQKIITLIARLHSKDSCVEMFRDLLSSLDPTCRRVDLSQFYKFKIQREDILWTYNVLN